MYSPVEADFALSGNARSFQKKKDVHVNLACHSDLLGGYDLEVLYSLEKELSTFFLDLEHSYLRVMMKAMLSI